MAASSSQRRRYGCFRIVLLLLGASQLCVTEKICNATVVEDQMDRATLTIVSRVNQDITLYSRVTECHECELKKTAVLVKQSNCTISVDSRWSVRYQITDGDGKSEDSCRERNEHFYEYGKYTIYVKYNNSRTKDKILCDTPVLMNMPADSNIPIYVSMGIFVGVALLWIFLVNCHRRHWFNRLLIRTGAERLVEDPKQIQPQKLDEKQVEDKHPTLRKRNTSQKQKKLSAYTSQDLGSMTHMQTNINPVDNEESKPKKERLKSLDTFRGISIVIMIFVNYRGGGYWFFSHSRWNGLTVADLVFPWFIFIMGTSLAFSYKNQLRRGTKRTSIFLRIFRRSCILFVLGLVINTAGSGPVKLTELRIPGVLQRFAFTYLIVASLHLVFVRSEDLNMHSYWSKVRDILDYWPEWLINFVILGVHIGITFGLDVPGCPKGYLGPGGDAESGKYQNCTGGAAGYIDLKVLGGKHVYGSPTCKEIYRTTVPYDPEGILGTLTSCFMCFLGLQAGKILMCFKDPWSRVIRFIVWGLILCLIAAILCKFGKDDGWVPINKNLWSVSFILCLAGMAFILLSVCYVTIDVWEIWNGAPFYYPGMNSIVLYMGHEILSRAFPVKWAVSRCHGSLLPMDIWGTCFWVLVSCFMYYKRVFLSL